MWNVALKMRKYKEILLSHQRRCDLRVISAYKAVVTKAVLVFNFYHSRANWKGYVGPIMGT